MSNVMVDLETMGTRSNAAIISIGACTLDGENRFYRAIFLDSSVEAGLTVDISTEEWWSKQSTEARQVLVDPARVTLIEALTDFSAWLQTVDSIGKLKIWGNGSDFDNVILANAYAAVNADTPWKFWNNRCFRTAKSFGAKIDIPRAGTYHNALDDALHQARILKAMHPFLT